MYLNILTVYSLDMPQCSAAVKKEERTRGLTPSVHVCAARSFTSVH